MKLTFLGTSHGQPTLTRKHSANLLQVNGKNYLIDYGSGAHTTLLRHGIEPVEVSAIFLTHMHLDHTSDLLLACGQSIQFRKQRPDLAMNIYIPGTEAMFERTKRALQEMAYVTSSYDLDSIRFHHIEPGLFFDADGLKMTAVPTLHFNPYRMTRGVRSNAFLIEAEGKKILYSGDLSCDAEFGDFPLKEADGCDAVICEATHFPPDKALPLLKTITAKRFIFNHVGIPDDGLDDFVKMVQSALPYPVSVASDDDVLEL